MPAARSAATTLRQIVRVRLPGRHWRLRISNLFGDEPLQVAACAIALARAPGRAEIDPASHRSVLFGGRVGVTVPPGEAWLSDVIQAELARGSDVAVTLALSGVPARQTSHPGSRATSFVAPGRHVDAAALPGAEPVEHWYWLSDLEAWSPPSCGALVAIGDSITDGRGSTTDGNDRWTDVLAMRLANEPPGHRGSAAVPAVLNAGLGGNRLLLDGIGPSLHSRFARDVLDRAGVSHALLQIGINDLGTWRAQAAGQADARARLVEHMIRAYGELAAQARGRGVAAIAATLTPFVGNPGYQPDADDEAARQTLNRWIRRADGFAAVADFDAALRDPADPSRVREGLHCGDWLHPSPAGFVALARAVPLPALLPRG